MHDVAAAYGWLITLPAAVMATCYAGMYVAQWIGSAYERTRHDDQ